MCSDGVGRVPTYEWVDVGVEGRQPLLLRQIMDIINSLLHSMIIEQNPDRAHLLHRSINDLLARLLALQVRLVNITLNTMFLDLGLRVVGVLLLGGEVRQEDVGALHGHEDGGGTADPAVAAGDDGFFALQLAGGFVELVAAVFGGEVRVGGGLGHVGLNAGFVLHLDGGLVAW